MKKAIESRVLYFILGLLISGVTVYAVDKWNASQIDFTPSNTEWKKSDGTDITNVKEAIDELYNKTNNMILSIGNIKKYSKVDVTNNNNFIYTAENDVTIIANCVAVCDPEDSRAYNSLSISSDGNQLLLEDYSRSDNKILKGKIGIYKLKKGQYVSCQSSAYFWGTLENRFIELKN